MTHLSPEQLQARLDDALQGRELAEADRHLESCATCREALAQLVAGDEALRDALTHDPGEAYFETFADRVEDRLRAEGLRGAQSRLGGEDRWFGWLRSPQKLAWVGGMAVVVAGAAIVLVTSREQRLATLDGGARLDERIGATEQRPPEPMASAPAPAAQDFAESELDRPTTRANEEAAPKEAAGRAAPAPAPARLQATTKNATGREVAVRDDRYATPPPPAAPSAEAAAPRAEGQGVRVGRERSATAMQKSATEPVPAPLTANAKLESREGAAGACGTVTDAAGRTLAGAVIVHVASGRSATSDASGQFCLPEGSAGDVAVMAVGYEPARLSLGAGPLAAALTPVSVMEGGVGTAGKDADEAKSLGATRSPAPSAFSAPDDANDPFAGSSTTAGTFVRTARGATSFASSTGSASAWDAAAAAWERVTPVVSGAGANEARAQAGDARYRAWKLAPTTARADAARRALAGYVLGAPASAGREQAVKRLAELGK